MIIFNNNSIGYVLDTDASKVIEAVRSTGVTITPAMMHYAHYLISNMKNIGTWQLSNAVYGFVGGTADSHKWNWKDTRDLDAAFRLTYFNSPTHSSNGASTNGTSSYIDTNFNPSLNLTTRNTYLSVYLKSVGTSNSSHITGATNSSIPTSTILMINRPNSSSFISSSSLNYFAAIPAQSILTGCLVGNSNSNNIFLYKNGLDLTNFRAVGTSTVFPNLNVVIGGSRTNAGVGSFSQITIPFYSIGAGLTDAQSIQQSQIVTNAQAILNRL